jgi:DNA repair protein RecN (Recombination protein N)
MRHLLLESSCGLDSNRGRESRRAVFSLIKDQLGFARLEAAGLEHDEDEIAVKREISQAGKGRAFVNNQLVSVGFLKEIARFLADIHGQNDQQTLAESDSQLAFVDVLADAEVLTTEVRTRYEEWQAVLHGQTAEQRTGKTAQHGLAPFN